MLRPLGKIVFVHGQSLTMERACTLGAVKDGQELVISHDARGDHPRCGRALVARADDYCGVLHVIGMPTATCIGDSVFVYADENRWSPYPWSPHP